MIDLNFNVPKCLSFKKVGGETRGMEFYETKLDVLLSDACIFCRLKMTQRDQFIVP